MEENERDIIANLRHLKVGDVLWTFKEGHWRTSELKTVSYPITAESKISWIAVVGFREEKKFPKGKPLEKGWFFTEAEALEAIWAKQNRFAIGNAVSYSGVDASVLRKIAALIDYKEKK